MFPPPRLIIGMWSLGHTQNFSSPLPHWVEFMPESLILVSFRNHIDVPVYVVSWPSGLNCLQAIIKLLQCSFGWSNALSRVHPCSMRQNLIWSSKLKATDGQLFLQFPNNCSNSFHLLTRLLADGLVAHCRLAHKLILWACWLYTRKDLR